jgi:hypothetical protein
MCECEKGRKRAIILYYECVECEVEAAMRDERDSSVFIRKLRFSQATAADRDARHVELRCSTS